MELRNLAEYKELLELKRLKKQKLQEIQEDKAGVRHVGYKVTLHFFIILATLKQTSMCTRVLNVQVLKNSR